ncbi:carcinoembryonic antigen-related cell adhesion molecule 6-like [Oreochromis aureus]|uniref:carcinoembryonic antigen-related cell adhesion molecule 6-like n=1 Tax=Oreochromis aureus TaxID=47969 RepID=UPI001954CE17|nr:carcinoembryonic antigen-related cell adhesion molecule 6-like [Oreochromis aureus]
MQITSSMIISAQRKNTRAYHPGVSEEFTGNKLQRRHILNVKMILIYVIIVALAVTVVGQGSLECNLTEPGPQTCFGVLGEPLVFYIPKKPRIKTSLKKSTDKILMLINDKLVTLNEKYKNRTTFFPNGTLKLKKVTKNDSGEYSMETHISAEGVLLHTVNIHLHILAPVSEPAVTQMCLSPKQMTVSCFSEGDEVEFILSLDDKLLIQSTADGIENNNISNVTINLPGQLMGNLTCVAQNNASRKQTITHLTSCTAPVSEPAVLQMCLSPEQMTVSCSSEGDEVEFIFLLDDNLLIKTQPSIAENHNISNVTISLHGQLMGKLMCIIRNNISREQTIIHLISCTGTTSVVTVVVLTSVAPLLLSFSILTLLLTVNKGVAEDNIFYSKLAYEENINQHTKATAR